MPLTKAQCTNCGANLEVDSAKEAAICPYCGAAYIVEKAINNYHIQTIQAENITILSPEDTEQRFKNAESLISLKRNREAKIEYSSLTKTHSYDSRGYVGLIRACTNDFQAIGYLERKDIEIVKNCIDALDRLKQENDFVEKARKSLQADIEEKHRRTEEETNRSVRKSRIGMLIFGIIVSSFVTTAFLIMYIAKLLR